MHVVLFVSKKTYGMQQFKCAVNNGQSFILFNKMQKA